MNKPSIQGNWLEENASLCGVSTRRFSVDRKGPGRPSDIDIGVRKSYSVTDDHIHFTWSCRINVKAKDDRDLGFIEVKLYADYNIGENHPEIEPSDAMRFGDKFASRDMYPYLRQSVDFLASQAGFERIRIAPLDFFTMRQESGYNGELKLSNRKPISTAPSDTRTAKSKSRRSPAPLPSASGDTQATN